MRPTIGLTCGFSSDGEQPPRDRSVLLASYSDGIYHAGGIPLALPAPDQADPQLIESILDHCDGVLFIGGDDIDPARYGCPPHPRTVVMHARRDRFELDLFRAADARRRPILGICLGHQTAHVARGGGLIQHIDDLPRNPPLKHGGVRAENAFHDIRIEPDSRLAQIVGAAALEVNSRHHQAVDPAKLGRGLRSVAFANDGLIEASEDCDGRFLLTVQWHPEDLLDRPVQRKLFDAFVDAARQ